MREHREYQNRTKVLSTDEPIKKYFLVYEGKDTERIYFNAMNLNRDKIGINPLIELIPILRCHREETWSNPKKITDRIIQNLGESASGKYSCESLLNAITELIEESNENHTLADTKTIELVFNEFCSSQNYTLETQIEDLDDFCTKLKAFLSDEKSFIKPALQTPKLLKYMKITYDKDFDKICIIVDRDRQSFKSTQYDQVVCACIENNFQLYVTNPLFEFWLLLHFDDVLTMPKDKLLANAKVKGVKRKYVEEQLNELLKKATTRSYNKTSYNTDYFIQNIDKAIKNATYFCENIDELKTNLGTNINLLIEELKE